VYYWKYELYYWKYNVYYWKYEPYYWKYRSYSWEYEPYYWKYEPYYWKYESYYWKYNVYYWKYKPLFFEEGNRQGGYSMDKTIPARDSDFTPWLRLLVNYVIAKTTGTPPDWGHITEAARLALTAQVEAWEAAWTAAQTTPTPANNKEKRRVRKEAERYVRTFINDYLRRPPVTDKDRDTMGIRTRASPAITPLFRACWCSLGTVSASTFGTRRSEAKPAGMNGCLLNYHIGEEQITDTALLTTTALMTRSPFTLELTPGDAGKVLSVAVRWQNFKGKLGSWSEIAYIVIG
jgi:hypothetical protein